MHKAKTVHKVRLGLLGPQALTVRKDKMARRELPDLLGRQVPMARKV